MPVTPVPAASPPAPAAVTSLFASLGPIGSVLTSIVVAAAGAASGWLASKGYIQGADQVTVTALIATFIATVAGIAYTAITNRFAAKVTAVAASPEVAMVVTTPAVANSDVHVADPKVLSPKDAATVLLGKPS